MKKIPITLSAILALCFISTTAWAQQTQKYNPDKVFDPTFLAQPGNMYRSGNGTPGPKYFTNRANYTIHVALSPKDTAVTGKETIEYINNSPDSLQFLWIKLGQDLFDPQSLGHAMMPPGGNRFTKPGDIEFCCGETVSNISVSLEGKTYHPDYVISDTRMQLRLHKPVIPNGGKVEVSMNFKFKVPKYGSDRMGRLKTKQGIIYEIAQWYPNMEVYDDIRGWAHLPYVGMGEFYDDYGNFNYYVTVPWYMIVAGSGVLQNPKEMLTKTEMKRYKKAQRRDSTTYIIKPDEVGEKSTRPVHHGTLTWHFKMHNSRDVAWAASKAFIWDGAKVDLSNGKKALAMSVYPKMSTGKGSWQKSTHMLKRSIEIFSKITGFPFPWKRATNVAGIAHGMEYPGIIFCYYNTPNALRLWNVTNHEIGHNWYPMIVGTNERRNMWMDEGFNTFIDGWASQIYKNGKYNYFGWDDPAALVRKMKNTANPQPLITRPDAMRTKFDILYYDKTSLGLNILRNVVVGKKLFDYAFRSYTKEWAYKHPRPVDFFNRMNDATGMDLNWFWKEWFYKNWKLDQAITNVKQKSDSSYYITIKNKDMMVMPVLVRAWESNGQVINKKLPVQVWQRHDTWTFKIKVNNPLTKVVLDPDKQLPDINRSNNTWTSQDKTLKPARKSMTAQKVIQHYIRAIGGKKKLKGVQDMSLTMTGMTQGYKVKMTEMKKRPNKFSLVVEVPALGRTVKTIKVNGDEVKLAGGNGQTATLNKAQKKQLEKNTIMFPVLKYNNSSYQIKLAGIKKDNGHRVYVVHVQGPTGLKKTIYYDVKSGLKTRVATKSSTVKFSHYKPVKGVKIPFVRVTSRGPGTSLTMKVQRVKINSGLMDSNFE